MLGAAAISVTAHFHHIRPRSSTSKPQCDTCARCIVWKGLRLIQKIFDSLMRLVLIHIGYPKTGSVWLQDRIFEKSCRGFSRVPTNIVDRYILEPDWSTFDAESAKEKLKAVIRTARDNSLTPVLSSVLLCGNANLNGGANGSMYADRLRTLLPDSKVLIVIREQRSWLDSFYRMEMCSRRSIPTGSAPSVQARP